MIAGAYALGGIVLCLAAVVLGGLVLRDALCDEGERRERWNTDELGTGSSDDESGRPAPESGIESLPSDRALHAFEPTGGEDLDADVGDDRTVCPHCRTENDVAYEFCRQCANSLSSPL